MGRVERAVPGVDGTDVNLATERAEIRFTAPTDPEALREAVQNAGFDVGASTVELEIDGIP